MALHTRHPDLAIAYATQSLRASQRIGLLADARKALSAAPTRRRSALCGSTMP